MTETNKYQWCIYNNQYLELHDLENEFYIDKANTRIKYKDKLWCPDCQQVQLAIKENANGIFLSAYPKSKHKNNCNYILKPAARTELVEYYNRIDGDLAERLLDRILEDRLFQLMGNQDSHPLNNNDENDIEFVLKNKAGVRKYLPRRTLQSRQMEETDHLVMYYGECKVFLAKQNTHYYLRIFRNDGSKSYACNLMISERVYSYLEDDLKFIPRSENLKLDYSRENAVPTKLAFVSTMKKHSNYYNAVLTYSKLLKVIQL